MKYLREIGNIGTNDALGIKNALDFHPELWNQHTLRTDADDSPHKADDIWVRYRRFKDWHDILHSHLQGRLNKGEAETQAARQRAVVEYVGAEHESVWYPAIDQLPHLRYWIFKIMEDVQAERLGGVLITRIPPGGEVKAHVDGGWHARYYNKVALQIASHPDQQFHFEDGGFSCPPGTLYTFDNSKPHWVSNPSPVERITAIICVHADRWKDGMVTMADASRPLCEGS